MIKWISRFLAAAVLALSGAAFAQPYVFAGAAQSIVAKDGAGIVHSGSNSFLLPGVGYRINRHFAVEASWFDPGNVMTTSELSGRTASDITFTQRSYSVEGGRLSLVGERGLGGGISALGFVHATFLRGTLQSATTKTSSGKHPVLLASSGSETSGSDVQLGLGAGIGYALPHKWRLRATLDWLRAPPEVFGAAPGFDAGQLRTLAFTVLKDF